ncbi:MAG TPA: hypothetical protein VJQ60_04075 [Arthrobacter sp.]|nr:hypothetical protein [Arthrobacter sp.]
MKHLFTALIAVCLLAFGGIATISAVQSSHKSSARDGVTSTSWRSSPSPSASSTPKVTPKPTQSPTQPQAAPTTPASTPVAAAPAPAPAVTAAATPTAAPLPVTGNYPLHTNIVSTTFWVGEIFNANLSDGSQVCSTYNGQWAMQHTGINLGTTPTNASGCPGSPYGGCDGVSSGTGSNFKCATEQRVASNGYFPLHQPKPLENPFYLDLPYDDVNDSVAFAERCNVIPWAAADNAATGVNHCADSNYSYMKNAWVQITGPNGNVCYGQVEDAGPSSGSLYHDSAYVFGANNARPVNKQFSGDPSQGAGMDVSPALNGCLGFASLDGDTDHVSWRFVDRASVPAGPWLTVVTTAGVTN